MNEIYISTDVETDGPIPGPHSMLSIGSAAYTEDKILSRRSLPIWKRYLARKRIRRRPNGGQKQPEAWAASRKDLEPPEGAMTRYVAWIKSPDGKPVTIAYPAGFDFMFVYWYLIKFVGESPFSHSALDIKSFAMALLKTNYRESTRNMPKRWFDKVSHTHVALEDAIEQGALFCRS